MMFVAELSRESPRGKVLIATGFMEQQLRNVLASFMRKSVDVDVLLDGSTAPLGTFSARITACHALGLITDDENHDLGLIRKIRNQFAHTTQISFDAPTITDRCAILRMIAPDYESEDRGSVVMTASQKFETAAVAIIMNLVNRPYYVGLERRTLRSWPY
jgi:mannitol operon repressor